MFYVNKAVIIALDFKNFEETKAFIDQFEESLYVKVGMELFYAEGPQIIKYLKEKNHKIFLDLKLHDIPNTVKSAMKNFRIIWNRLRKSKNVSVKIIFG